MKKDKDLVLTCDCIGVGHHIIFSQSEDPEVYITVHLDTIPFWQRVRWVLMGRNKKYGHFVSTMTTKEKLQDIVNQLE